VEQTGNIRLFGIHAQERGHPFGQDGGTFGVQEPFAPESFPDD
jgi:hypothetical protein